MNRQTLREIHRRLRDAADHGWIRPLLLASLSAALVGCGANAPQPTGLPTDPPASAGAFSDFVRLAESRIAVAEQAWIRAGARPTVALDESNRIVPLLLRDDDRSEWPAGKYEFTLSCAGAGSVKATVRIGELLNRHIALNCLNTGAAKTLKLELANISIGSTVQIRPTTTQTAAVAYSFSRM